MSSLELVQNGMIVLPEKSLKATRQSDSFH